MENKQKFFKAKFNDTKKIISYKKSFEDLLANLESPRLLARDLTNAPDFSGCTRQNRTVH